MNDLYHSLHPRLPDIYNWLNQKRPNTPPLPYSSVDIRESYFKIASIDTNVFPAGFNNLVPAYQSGIVESFQLFLQTYYPQVRHILLCCEDHTRNTFYLENVYAIQHYLELAGVAVTIGSFFNDHPHVCHDSGYLDIQTAHNHTIRVHCLAYIVAHRDAYPVDLCMLNNDLTDGKYNELMALDVPIIPDPQMGWHRRKKSDHFAILNNYAVALVADLGLAIDPWLITTYFSVVSAVDIHNDTDRERLADAASDLLVAISAQYKQHGITESPYLVLKSDSGTYGMGVIRVFDPMDIRQLNRKNRNKLAKGKASIPIETIMIQEGIPSVRQVNNIPSEEVIYSVGGNTVGGFYRFHPEKTGHDILNARGMQFSPLVPATPSPISDIIARLADVSAHHESIGS
jgi:glutamate--cysteine ligase